MAAQVDFKVFLKKNNSSNQNHTEIRRFTIDADVVTNFTYLREKLQTVFPDLRGKRFTVAWKDFENDEIVICSCEELEIALGELQKFPLCKLYVTLHSDYDDENKCQQSPFVHFDAPNNPKSKPKHVGIICDGCDKNVCGFRYKCVQCADYDLCSECEAKGLHPEHCMIRISMPLQWRSHYGRRLSHHINKFMKKASTCPSSEEDPKDCPFKSRRHNLYNRQAGQSPSWIDTFTTYLNDWTNLPGECLTKEQEKSKDSNSEQNQSTANKASSASTNEKSPMDIQVEFFKNFNENISQVLDTLGIDVNVQVKTDESPTTEKPLIDIKLSESHNPQNIEKVTTDDDKNHKEVDDSVQPAASDLQEKCKPILKTDIKEGNQPTNDAANLNADEWTLLDKDSVSTSSDVASDKIAQNQNPSQPTVENSKATDDKGLYPSLPNVSDNIWHPNPKIQRAVEAMMQMGFSNEGGWLTQLLISKNGNISRALDVLQPAR